MLEIKVNIVCARHRRSSSNNLFDDQSLGATMLRAGGHFLRKVMSAEVAGRSCGRSELVMSLCI